MQKKMGIEWLHAGRIACGHRDHCAVDLHPSAGAGRGSVQANLVYCQSNLRAIGQLIQMYAAENHGCVPPCEDQNTVTTTLATCSRSEPERQKVPQRSLPGAARYTCAFGRLPDHDLQIFRDVDTPSEMWLDHACAYVANIRAMGAFNLWDPLTNNTGWKLRQLSTLRRTSNVMIVWCGPCNIESNGTNDGCYHNYPNALDNYGMYGGHGFTYPTPASRLFSRPGIRIRSRFGLPIGVGGSPSSMITGSVTPSYLKVANAD